MSRYLKTACLAAIVLSLAVAADAASWQAGIKGGLAIETLGGDDVDSDNIDSRTGFAGGAFAQADFNRHFGMRLEALYFMKGASADSAAFEAGFEFDYLEFPVLLLAHVPVSDTGRLTFFGGPTLGINVGADLTAKYEGLEGSLDVGEYIADFEFGLTFGAGMSFDVGQVVLGIDGRYGLGLTTVDDAGDEEADVKNQGFAFMASLGFPLGSQ